MRKVALLILVVAMSAVSLTASASSSYMDSVATIADVHEIAGREYGQAVDKMTLYVSVGFGLIALFFAAAIGLLWKARTEYNDMKKDLANKRDELTADLTGMNDRLTDVMSNFADVISLSITEGDIKTQAVVDDVPGAGMKTREVMAKLQLIEKCRDLTVDEKFARGMNFYAAGDFESAYDVFNGLASTADSEATRFWSLFNSAACSCRLMDYKGALNSIEQALRIRPGNAKAILMKATLMTQFGDLDAAYDFYSKGFRNAIGDFKEYENELTAFTDLLIRKGMLDMAEKLIDEMSAKGIDNAALRYNKICIKARRGDEGEDLAYELFNLLKSNTGLVGNALSDPDLYRLLSANEEVRIIIQKLQTADGESNKK